MGLDVTAYKKLTLINGYRNDDDEIINDDTNEEIGDAIECWDNKDFLGRSSPLVSGKVYQYAEAVHALSSGYGGHSRWRDTLAKISGWPMAQYTFFGKVEECYAAGAWAAQEGPFWELINFSDCEGFIGSDACKKLAQDFIAYREVAAKEDADFYARYLLWQEAVVFASNDGALQFH